MNSSNNRLSIGDVVLWNNVACSIYLGSGFWLLTDGQIIKDWWNVSACEGAGNIYYRDNGTIRFL